MVEQHADLHGRAPCTLPRLWVRVSLGMARLPVVQANAMIGPLIVLAAIAIYWVFFRDTPIL